MEVLCYFLVYHMTVSFTLAVTTMITNLRFFSLVRGLGADCQLPDLTCSNTLIWASEELFITARQL
jgi:hypothetical protein